HPPAGRRLLRRPDGRSRRLPAGPRGGAAVRPPLLQHGDQPGRLAALDGRLPRRGPRGVLPPAVAPDAPPGAPPPPAGRRAGPRPRRPWPWDRARRVHPGALPRPVRLTAVRWAPFVSRPEVPRSLRPHARVSAGGA